MIVASLQSLDSEKRKPPFPSLSLIRINEVTKPKMQYAILFTLLALACGAVG